MNTQGGRAPQQLGLGPARQVDRDTLPARAGDLREGERQKPLRCGLILNNLAVVVEVQRKYADAEAFLSARWPCTLRGTLRIDLRRRGTLRGPHRTADVTAAAAPRFFFSMIRGPP